MMQAPTELFDERRCSETGVRPRKEQSSLMLLIVLRDLVSVRMNLEHQLVAREYVWPFEEQRVL